VTRGVRNQAVHAALNAYSEHSNISSSVGITDRQCTEHVATPSATHIILSKAS
jgi:hypothetical protein